jgi:hypothetical protein
MKKRKATIPVYRPKNPFESRVLGGGTNGNITLIKTGETGRTTKNIDGKTVRVGPLTTWKATPKPSRKPTLPLAGVRG